MPVSATVTRVLVVSASCQRALVVSGTVRKGVFKRTSYTLNLLDQDVVTFVSALIHNRQLSVQDRDAMGVVSGLVRNATLLLVDADALSMQSGVVINGQLGLRDRDVLSMASRLIHNSTLTLSDRDMVTFASGLAAEGRLELEDSDAVTFDSAKVFNATLTLADRDGLSGESHVVHNAALLLADVDVLTSAGGLIYNSAVQLADGDLLALVGGLVRNRSLVLVDADSVMFASGVVDGGGGSNPYILDGADHHWDFASGSITDLIGAVAFDEVNFPSIVNEGPPGGSGWCFRGDGIAWLETPGLAAYETYSGNVTVRFWYRKPASLPSEMVIVGWGSWGWTFHKVSGDRLRISRNQIQMFSSNNQFTAAFPDNDWHKVEIQWGWNGGLGARLFVDDVQYITNSSVASGSLSSRKFTLGYDNDGGRPAVSGDIAEVSIKWGIPS